MSRYIDAEGRTVRLIGADALKKGIARLHVLNDEAEIRRVYEYNPHVTSTDFEETLVSVFDVIEDAPSIDIEPKRGEWIRYINDYGIKETKCSACDATFATGDGYGWNYCPWCGADMREESE